MDLLPHGSNSTFQRFNARVTSRLEIVARAEAASYTFFGCSAALQTRRPLPGALALISRDHTAFFISGTFCFRLQQRSHACDISIAMARVDCSLCVEGELCLI
jgi:hypothetical protein